MALFRLIGDPRHEGQGPKEDTIFGVHLSRADPVCVPDDDPAAAKLRTHSHVEEVDAGAALPVPVSAGADGSHTQTFSTTKRGKKGG